MDESKSELEILTWVQSLGLEAHKYRLEDKEIDIFVPSKNIGIEYNELYWHTEIVEEVKDEQGNVIIKAKPCGKPTYYHRDKTQFFKERGIRIIHVWEHIWRDRQEQIKSYIRSALGANEHRIGARKCELKEVGKEETKTFLESTHIQGASQNIKLSLGLYYQNELLALATFGRHHRQTGGIVLNRFCGKTNWTVSGGLSRLTKEGFKRLGPILTWADLSLSDAQGYINSGWVFEEGLSADYTYYHPATGRVCSKQSRKKKCVNTPEWMTEWEHAKREEWYRFTDCGKVRMIYNPD